MAHSKNPRICILSCCIPSIYTSENSHFCIAPDITSTGGITKKLITSHMPLQEMVLNERVGGMVVGNSNMQYNRGRHNDMGHDSTERVEETTGGDSST